MNHKFLTLKTAILKDVLIKLMSNGILFRIEQKLLN